jgi:osmotically-inducible protein OsmY
MKNNLELQLELQNDVQNAIKWEPSLNASEIGVAVRDGVVTLSGTVDSYSKKLAAERAIKNVVGVRAVAEDINIDYGNSFIKDDAEVATEVLIAWKYNWEVPDSKIKVKVENGWVSLEGEVSWNFQKEAAKNAISKLAGVKGVTNGITLNSGSKDTVEKDAIARALNRNWSINGRDISVVVNHNDVKLIGKVKSIYQKEQAGRLAWNTLGVNHVENELTVIYKLPKI